MSMNDDIYLVSQKPATCLKEDSELSAPDLFNDSTFQSLWTNLEIGSKNFKFSYQIDLQCMHNKRWGWMIN